MNKISSHDSEEVARVGRTVMTRAETRAQADDLFTDAKKYRKMDREKLEKLFIQMPGAETMSPMLVKTSAATFATGMLQAIDKEKRASASAVYSFFENQEWLTDAQRRFPELLKVASPRHAASPKPVAAADAKSGKTPTRSNLAGGAP